MASVEEVEGVGAEAEKGERSSRRRTWGESHALPPGSFHIVAFKATCLDVCVGSFSGAIG